MRSGLKSKTINKTASTLCTYFSSDLSIYNTTSLSNFSWKDIFIMFSYGIFCSNKFYKFLSLDAINFNKNYTIKHPLKNFTFN